MVVGSSSRDVPAHSKSMKHTRRDRAIVGVMGAVLFVVGMAGSFWYPVLGVPHADTMHDVLHFGSGLLALRSAIFGKIFSTRSFCRAFGVIYALVVILGFIGNVPMKTSDSPFHFLAAAVFLYVGYRETIPHDTDRETPSLI